MYFSIESQPQVVCIFFINTSIVNIEPFAIDQLVAADVLMRRIAAVYCHVKDGNAFK